MGTSRWDPFNELVGLREAMGNLLEEGVVRGRQAASGTAGLAVDVRETPDAFEVTASIPGVAPDDVDITVFGDTLRIRGERREEPPADAGAQGTRWLLRERRYGPFERTIALPVAVESEAATADFEEGVLTITLPKSAAARPRSIPVRGAGRGAGAAQTIEIEGGTG